MVEAEIVEEGAQRRAEVARRASEVGGAARGR